MQQTFFRLSNENPQFNKFIHTAEKKPECNLHSLQDFSISIVQRIPQYITLLNDLMKNTQDLKEYSQLQIATSRLKEVANGINQQKKEKENMKQLKNIFLEYGIKEIPLNKNFVYEETVYKTETSQRSEKEQEDKYYRLIIFTDEIWIVKLKSHVLQSIKKFALNIHISPLPTIGDTAFKLGKNIYYTSKSIKLTQLLYHFSQLPERKQQPPTGLL
uniref:DH domain-containing protein n=1 Tax=Arcella intermedia TaxID=1963864 RepID=A0A6B2LHB8_9EUKA